MIRLSPPFFQITTQIQKLQLDWPDQIRSFFATLNLLSLSFSALSPRCVVSHWEYLNKIPVMNAAPILVYLFLLLHGYFLPRLLWVFRWIWSKLLPWLTEEPGAVRMLRHGAKMLNAS